MHHVSVFLMSRVRIVACMPHSCMCVIRYGLCSSLAHRIMAVSDGMTPRKSPALATWRGTPGRSPSRQVLGCGLGHTGLFARTAPPELPPSPPPPQRSHLLTPPVRGVASAQPAGEQGLRYRSHAGRNDAKSGSGAATQDTLQGRPSDHLAPLQRQSIRQHPWSVFPGVWARCS